MAPLDIDRSAALQVVTTSMMFYLSNVTATQIRVALEVAEPRIVDRRAWLMVADVFFSTVDDL